MSNDLNVAVKENLIRYGGDMFPEVIVSAKGSYVTDITGRTVLDFTSGQMCATVGHNHPAIIAAIQKSADKAIHLFSGMIPDSVARLARKLSAIMPAPLKRSMFVSTGSESNEAALKMAKLATGGFEVIALGGSWHGITGGAGAVSYASDRKGMGPSMPGVYAIPEPNAYRCPIEHCRDRCDLTCMKVGLRLFDMQSNGAPAAIIVEPVISAGGVIVPPAGYFEALKRECEARGMLLIFDEAQTAFGRLGAWSAAEKLGVTPDIMTVSKTLGGGVPLAGVITSDAVEEKAHTRGFAFYTSHVSDPLPASVGEAVINVIEGEGLMARALEIGGYLHSRLEGLQQRYEAIGDIRGEGMLLGVELVQDRSSREPFHELGARTTKRCIELGLSMNIRRRPERGSVWRIAPPLTTTRSEIDEGIDILDRALSETLDEMARAK
jgi:2,2-dialkylglycine decarboxylase (pyruvate)